MPGVVGERSQEGSPHVARIRTQDRFGGATFVVVLLAAVLPVLPVTAILGGVLCVVALVPAVIARWRARRDTPARRHRATAALALAPTFFVVAVLVSPHQPVPVSSA